MVLWGLICTSRTRGYLLFSDALLVGLTFQKQGLLLTSGLGKGRPGLPVFPALAIELGWVLGVVLAFVGFQPLLQGEKVCPAQAGAPTFASGVGTDDQVQVRFVGEVIATVD